MLILSLQEPNAFDRVKALRELVRAVAQGDGVALPHDLWPELFSVARFWPASARVQETALYTFANIIHKENDVVPLLIEAGLLELIMAASRRFPANFDVQKAAGLVIRNTAGRVGAAVKERMRADNFAALLQLAKGRGGAIWGRLHLCEGDEELRVGSSGEVGMDSWRGWGRSLRSSCQTHTLPAPFLQLVARP